VYRTPVLQAGIEHSHGDALEHLPLDKPPAQQ
jgi:hypothetical protein